ARFGRRLGRPLSHLSSRVEIAIKAGCITTATWRCPWRRSSTPGHRPRGCRHARHRSMLPAAVGRWHRIRQTVCRLPREAEQRIQLPFVSSERMRVCGQLRFEKRTDEVRNGNVTTKPSRRPSCLPWDRRDATSDDPAVEPFAIRTTLERYGDGCDGEVAGRQREFLEPLVPPERPRRDYYCGDEVTGVKSRFARTHVEITDVN